MPFDKDFDERFSAYKKKMVERAEKRRKVRWLDAIKYPNCMMEYCEQKVENKERLIKQAEDEITNICKEILLFDQTKEQITPSDIESLTKKIVTETEWAMSTLETGAGCYNYVSRDKRYYSEEVGMEGQIFKYRK